MPDINAANPPKIDTAQQLRRALAAITDMREKLAAAEGRAHEPIAIIGMACRFPGAPDLDAYWRLLVDGVDAVREVPADRWDIDDLYDPDPDAPGKMSSRWGGFIDQVDRFDAPFFGISPREAVSLDPQHRLLLELSWHALENAAIPPDSLAGSATGVYVGMSTNDYARILAQQDGAGWIDAHASLGNSVAVAAGRLSYSLGLQGPSMVVDTACSSSLVAVHLAARALRAGEVRLAIAAGVNLMLSPELTIGFSKARMMAADGRCKTLDAAADGYVRGEGCGVIVLKRLSDALADGDRIHAIILGSAVNQDGRSNGLTAPNGPAQAAVIRAALTDARLSPDDVGAVEMHGTGTPLGDPIEVRALASVFGGRAVPALIGSVKTNIGHLESAAGMAGLIKMALATGRGRVPAHLNFRTLNPHIAADGFPFQVPVTTRGWPDAGGRAVAGVSSFGFSGTNAHVIVAAPPSVGDIAPARPVSVLTLSARDAAGLDQARQDLHRTLSRGVTLPDLAATLTAGRSHHTHRLAIVASHATEALAALDTAPVARATDATPPLALLFTGQGCQYPGLGRDWMGEDAFRSVIDQCDAVLGDALGLRLPDLLTRDDVDLTPTDRLQPVLFAYELAMVALWREWGVSASAVIGHSVGEIAACCHAGVMSIDDGMRFMLARGRAMQATAGRGGMAALLAGEDQVHDLLCGTGAVIAGLNAPGSIVIAGDHASLARALDRAQAAGVAAQRLDVATAFHSAVLDPVLGDIHRAAASMACLPPRLPIAANLTGALHVRFDADYWRDQARSTVRFSDGLRALAARGITHFLEVGPQPVLSGLGRRTLPDATFIAVAKRGGEAARSQADALAALYRAGLPVDWAAWQGGDHRRWRPVAAPTYPFRRDRHWLDAAPKAAPVMEGQSLPLLGTKIDAPISGDLYRSRLDGATQPFLSDHVVFGQVVAPGAMHAVMGLILAARAGHHPVAIGDLVFAQALTVPNEGLALSVTVEGDGFAVHGKTDGTEGWTRHASGQLRSGAATAPPALDLEALRARMAADPAGPDALFTMLAERGIKLGPCFQGLHRIWRGNGEALAEITRPPALDGAGDDMPLHPALLDSCFQLLGATFSGQGTSGGFLPLSVDRITLWQRPGARFHCHARIADAGPSADVAIGHFTLTDDQGRVLAAVEGLQIKRVAAPAARDPVADAMLGVDWLPVETPAAADLPTHDLSTLADAARAHQLPAEADTGLAQALEDLAAAFAGDAMALGDPGVDLAPGQARLWARVRSMARGRGGASMTDVLRTRFPDNRGEIDLVARCGEGLPGVLRGRTDPLGLIFGDGGGSVYEGAGLAGAANAMAAAITGAVARPGLRVLEAGAGTGATTAALLENLSADAAYHFTDISPAFLNAAAKRFGDRITTGLFDLEKPPAAQGLEPADLVIAANVVHATADIAQSLDHLAAVTAPGGFLVLVESTGVVGWWDIVFGLTPGWWRFTDKDLRPDHALLPAERWASLLAAHGFAAVATVPVDDAGMQSVIIARRDVAPWLLIGGGALASDLATALARTGRTSRVVPNVEGADLSGPLAGVALLAAVDATDQEPLRAAFVLTRHLIHRGAGPLILVTRGASNPDGASLWGLGRVAALEHPELDIRLVDLHAQGDAIAALLTELTATDTPAEVRWYEGRRQVSRLVRAPLPPAAPMLSETATYLVTGAFGGLGPLLAQWLVERGARHLLLVGRHVRPVAVTEGVNVVTRVLDVADPAATAALFAQIDAGLVPPLKGVFHLAGGTADGTLIGQDWERFASILPAKIDGARLLHEHTIGRDLDHFVLFSTSAALIGNQGQANHAAANAYLSALAASRRSAGLPGLAIDWGAWGQVGAVVAGRFEGAMAARGVRAFAPDAGFDGLGRMMASGTRSRYGFVDVDWPSFLAGYRGQVPTFLSAFAPVVAKRAAPANVMAGGTLDLRARLSALPVDARADALITLLRAEAAQVLGLDDATCIDPTQALNEMGLDSLLALDLRNRLSAALGTAQPATLLFNYPSVAALADHVTGLMPDLFEPVTAILAKSDDRDQALINEVAGMSDADLEAFLDAELAELAGGR